MIGGYLVLLMHLYSLDIKVLANGRLFAWASTKSVTSAEPKILNELVYQNAFTEL